MDVAHSTLTPQFPSGDQPGPSDYVMGVRLSPGPEKVFRFPLGRMVPLVVYKSGDESVTSSEVLQDDNELQVSSLPIGRWNILIALYFSVGTAGNMKIAISGTSVPTRLVLSYHNATSVLTAYDVSLQLGATNDPTLWILAGSVDIATPGSFKIQWAQQAASGTPTTVKAGSSMQLERAG